MPKKIDKNGESFIVSDEVDFEQIDTENMVSHEDPYAEVTQALRDNVEHYNRKKKAQEKFRTMAEEVGPEPPGLLAGSPQDAETGGGDKIEVRPDFEAVIRIGKKKTHKLTGRLVNCKVESIMYGYEFIAEKENALKFAMMYQGNFKVGRGARPEKTITLERLKITDDELVFNHVPPNGNKGKKAVIVDCFKIKRFHKNNKARCYIEFGGANLY